MFLYGYHFMSFKPEDYVGQDEHFSARDAKSFFEALENGDFPELEKKFEICISNAETKMEKFFDSVLESTLSDESKSQIEGARSMMRSEFTKIKKWFSDRITEMKSKPNDAASKMKAFKEEFLRKWTDFRKWVAEKTKNVRKLVSATDKNLSINAEAIIMKVQSVAKLITPKLKYLFAVSKAAAKGAIKGVKDMQKNKDESDKNKN